MAIDRAAAPVESKPRWLSFGDCVKFHGLGVERVAAIMRRAVRLLSSHGWTQREGACNAAGERVLFSSPDAARFSLNGALMRASAELGGSWQECLAAGNAVADAVGLPAILYNDDRQRSFSEVMDAMCRALWRVQTHSREEAA